MPSLDVFLHDQFVGNLLPSARNKTRVILDVDQSYGDLIVLSESFAALPGRRPRTESVSNFLGGYVPEGNHRDAMAAKRGINKDNLFALLREFGGSIAGAVTLRQPDESKSYAPDYELLDDHQLERKLQQALDDSDQAIADDSRSTLPGYQPKVLVRLVDGRWAYPHGRAHSTHILKPQIPARPTRLFDEHYVHLLTKSIGLSRYASEIRVAGSTTYLGIERFDRVVIDGQVHTHHQEDMSQAMALDWRETDVKFQDALRPNDPKRATVRRIARTLSSIPRGDVAVEQWLRQLTFHVAIGNNDAHAKNVALMHLSSGAELSQVYDALPNFFQEGLVKWDLALAINGIFDHRQLSLENIVAEATSWGVIAESRASEVVLETLDALNEALATVTAPRGISNGVVEQLEWNVHRLISFEMIGERRRT